MQILGSAHRTFLQETLNSKVSTPADTGFVPLVLFIKFSRLSAFCPLMIPKNLEVWFLNVSSTETLRCLSKICGMNTFIQNDILWKAGGNQEVFNLNSW